MRHAKFFVLALALAALTAGAAAASDLWVHVKVVDDEGKTNVTVNLPLTFLEKALAMVPEEHLEGGKIALEEMEINAAQLRELWQTVQDTPNMTFVTVEGENETIEVAKDGTYLLVRTVESTDQGAQVNVKLPLAVVDALLSGEGNQLDIRAAFAALAAHGQGELVTVSDHRAHVRVWIDSVAEAR